MKKPATYRSKLSSRASLPRALSPAEDGVVQRSGVAIRRCESRRSGRDVAISFFILYFSICNGWDLPPVGRNVAAWHPYRTHRNSTPPQQCSRRGDTPKKMNFVWVLSNSSPVLASPSERLVERCRAREGIRPAGSKQRISGSSGRIPEQRLRDPAGDGREEEGAGQADEGQSPAQDAHLHGQAADGPQ